VLERGFNLVVASAFHGVNLREYASDQSRRVAGRNAGHDRKNGWPAVAVPVGLFSAVVYGANFKGRNLFKCNSHTNLPFGRGC
jgi:hypothetical protein